MKKNIFKTLTCLIAILLIGCEEEHNSHEHEQNNFSKVNFEDIPEIANLLKPETGDMARNHTMGVLDSIVEEDVIVIEKEDGTKSYTFALTITEPATQMTNLVIEETDEGYKYFTVTYESDNLETWVSQVKSMEETTVQVEITKNNLGDFSARDGDCESIEIQAVCPSGQHHGTDFASCDFHRNQWSYMVVFKVVPCAGSSGGGSSSGGGGSSSGSTSGTTSPNVKTPLFTFISSLSPEQRAWWANVQNISAKIVLNTFLIQNNNSPGSENFVRWAIEYLRTNPSVSIAQIQNWFMKPSEGKDGNYDADFWENPNLDLPQQNLPSMQNFLYAFPKIQNGNVISNMPSTQVYQLVGGSILSNHQSTNPIVRANYQNACSVRGSRALNYSGASIPVVHQNGVQKTEKGGDDENYILSAKAFNKYMNKTFGPPTYRLTFAEIGGNLDNIANFLQGKNGIYTIINRSPGLAGYSGHVDVIINGQCLGGANANPSGGVEYIEIWELN